MTAEKKKLYRSRNERMIAGVCGGISEYFEIDPTLVRLVFVAASLITGSGVLAYLICLILMPLEPLEAAPPASVEIIEPTEEN